MDYKKLVGISMLLLSLLFVVEAQFPFDRPSRHVLNGGGGPPQTTTTPQEEKKEEIAWTLFGVTIKLKDILALSFIVIFVLILLALGGVWKPGVGLPSFQFIFIGLVALLLIVPMMIPLCSTFEESKGKLCIAPYTEVPSNLKGYELPDYAKLFFHKLLGLPEEWGYVPAIIYLFILPFAAVYTLAWAFLQSLGIFSNVPSSVNRVLALIIAFLSIPVGYFIKIVSILFGFLGIWSVVIFAATFIVGAFFRGAGVAGREYTELKKLVDVRRARIRDALKQLEALKDADLQTIQQQLSPLLRTYADIFPTTVAGLLSEALQQKKAEDAQAHIKQAISELKRLL